jgi:hypothetical protein
MRNGSPRPAVGLVVAPVVLKTHDLVPEQQTRSDTEAVKPHLTPTESGPALIDPGPSSRTFSAGDQDRVAGSPVAHLSRRAGAADRGK